MDFDGRAILSDFGVSNVIEELQSPSFMTSKVAGSAKWAAPELFTSNDNVPEPNFFYRRLFLGQCHVSCRSVESPFEAS